MPQKSRLAPEPPKQVSLSALVANPKNPRTHPDGQLERLAEALKLFGQIRPILARKENGMVIGGHGVLEAAGRAGFDRVSVSYWDVDQKTADAYMVADNRMGALAQDHDDRIAAILRDLEPENYLAIGFSLEEASELLRPIEEADLEIIAIDATDVSDRFWISVSGPLKGQAHALKRLRETMADIENVEVRLGTAQ